MVSCFNSDNSFWFDGIVPDIAVTRDVTGCLYGRESASLTHWGVRVTGKARGRSENA